MKIEEANKVIHDYSLVMEITSNSTASSITFLPYPINEIKKAIKIALLVEGDSSQIEVLKTGYIRLATFIPIEEAQVILRFENYAFEKYYAGKKVLPNKIQYPNDEMLKKKYAEIQKKIARKMKELLREIS